MAVSLVINRSILSKSKLLSYRQCPLRLWNDCHRPDQAAKPSPKAQRIFDAGKRFGEYARTLFPDGKLVAAEYWDRDGALEQTANLLKEEECSILFEAAFLSRNTFVRCDVLERTGNSEWAMWEVKTVAKPSELHIFDLAVQTLVASESLGSMSPRNRLASSGIVHLANASAVKIVLQGGGAVIPIRRTLFTGQIEDMLPTVSALISEAYTIAERKAAPIIGVGDQCWKPYSCSYLGTLCN